MRIILASASPRRRELLAKHGFRFEVIPSGAPEPDDPDFRNAAMENAFRKAEEVAARFPDAAVAGVDTVIELDGKILGKPSSMDDAFRMLRAFSGRKHLVTSGVAILRLSDHTVIRFAECTGVFFKKLSDADIRTYLSMVNVMDKAGAYAIQEHGGIIIDHIEGDMENVVGLPARVSEALRALELQE